MAGRLGEIAALFLRLGATAFGGPAAHIALMEDELCARRGWLRRDEFLDLVGAANLIPGPNSTEVAMHAGYRRAGIPGLVVAGLCFILPAALLVLGLAMAYVRFGAVPAVLAGLAGVKAVVIAIVGQALLRLGRSALPSMPLGVLAGASAVAVALGAGELVVLLAAGVVAAAAAGAARGATGVVPLLGAPLVVPATTAVAPGTGGLFLVFLKIGSVVFGSGYVLLAFLRAELVSGRGLISETQLLDAVAVGQVTPGPLFTAATFIGYLIAGTSGAAVATAGIFLPAFVFVGASGPLVRWLRSNRIAGAFLDGVNAASLALMAVVSFQLARAAVVDAPTAALAILGALALWRRVPSMWIILAGVLVGLLRGVLA